MTVYEKITSEKEASFGKTMTVKEACDLWWNSVRIQSDEKIIVWKNIDDNSYSCNIYDDYDEDDSEELKELLNKEITLESDYYYDEDGEMQKAQRCTEKDEYVETDSSKTDK